MNRKDRARNNTRTAVVMAVLIVVLAIASWLYMSRIDVIMGKVDSQSYQNVTFTDEQAQQYRDKKLILVSLQAFPEHYQAHVTEAIKAFEEAMGFVFFVMFEEFHLEAASSAFVLLDGPLVGFGRGVVGEFPASIFVNFDP